MLFSTLARITSQQPFDNKKDDVMVYVDAYKGDTEAIEKLKSLGCENMEPIYCAAQQGNAVAISALRDAGADVNTPKEDSRTPVFIAAQFGHAEAITVLKKAGANVDTPERSMGATPVYMAAYNGHAAAITALKNAGANVHTPSTRVDATPVYVAVINGHVEALTALLDAGADASIGISRLKKADLLDAMGVSGPFSFFSFLITGLFSNEISTLWQAIIDSPQEGNTPLKVAIAQQDKSEAHQEIARLLKMHFLQYPNGVKSIEQHSRPILTKYRAVSKSISEADLTITHPEKRLQSKIGLR